MTNSNLSCQSPNFEIKSKSMYAIAFDLDQKKLEASYPTPSHTNAYKDIEALLAKHHFTRKQGSVYFGDMSKVDVVSTFLAITALTRTYDWFSKSLSDIRILRIEDNNNAMPIVLDAIKTQIP